MNLGIISNRSTPVTRPLVDLYSRIPYNTNSMSWLERLDGKEAITNSVRQAKHISSIIEKDLPLSNSARQAFEAYTTGYILQKEAVRGSRLRNSPAWPVTRWIPPVSLTVRWSKTEDQIAKIAFTEASEIALNPNDFTHDRLQSLANLLSTIYLSAKKTDPAEISHQIQAAAKSWLTKEQS